MRSLYLLLPLMTLTMVNSLPVPKIRPETNVTESQMEERIKHILTAPGYPKTDIEKALQMVPVYYAQRNDSRHRQKRQVLDVHVAPMTSTPRVTQSTTPSTTTTTTTTTPTPLDNSLNNLLHELNIFWKG